MELGLGNNPVLTYPAPEKIFSLRNGLLLARNPRSAVVPVVRSRWREVCGMHATARRGRPLGGCRFLCVELRLA